MITLQVIVSERTFYPTTTQIIEVCKDWDDKEISKEIDRYSLEVAKTYTDNLDSDEYHDMIRQLKFFISMVRNYPPKFSRLIK